MAETRVYQPSATERNLRLWIVKAFQGEGLDAEVIYANQGANRIDRPFALLQIITEDVVQYPFEIVTDNVKIDGTYEVQMLEHRAGSVQITTHGSMCWQMIDAIARSIRRSDVIDYNTENGIEIMRPLTGINDIPLLLSTQVEPRKQQDYEYAFARKTIISTVSAYLLERVIATGSIENQTPNPVEPIIDESWP
jgi:hypothetical protein